MRHYRKWLIYLQKTSASLVTLVSFRLYWPRGWQIAMGRLPLRPWQSARHLQWRWVLMGKFISAHSSQISYLDLVIARYVCSLTVLYTVSKGVCKMGVLTCRFLTDHFKKGANLLSRKILNFLEDSQFYSCKAPFHFLLIHLVMHPSVNLTLFHFTFFLCVQGFLLFLN